MHFKDNVLIQQNLYQNLLLKMSTRVRGCFLPLNALNEIRNGSLNRSFLGLLACSKEIILLSQNRLTTKLGGEAH